MGADSPGDVGARVHTLATQTHGRYLVHQPTQPPPWPLLVGFHGYGENAEIHLGELLRVPGAEVQALHPFYAKAGGIVASWMTSQDRDLAIADNLDYVGRIIAQLRTAHPVCAPLVFVGFSQGGAMAYRAAARLDAQGLVILAADVPPDVAAHRDHPVPPVLIGRGRHDRWYTAEALVDDRDTLARIGTTVEVCEFDDGHLWTDPFRDATARFLRGVRTGNGGA
jgi:predicted esterase